MSKLREQVAAGSYMQSPNTAPANLGIPATSIVLPNQIGSARSNLSVKVTVEPIEQGTFTWYRITAEGTADYIGPRHNSGGGNWAASGALDQVHRQIRLVKDSDGSVIPSNVSARSHRIVEVIARPVVSFPGSGDDNTRDGFGAAWTRGRRLRDVEQPQHHHRQLRLFPWPLRIHRNGVMNKFENGGVATNGELIQPVAPTSTVTS